MSEFDSTIQLPSSFSGSVRLFPLPNFVMFPTVVQPLRIFEPRYCEMLEAALADDHLITMALLKPGWENTYNAEPEIEETVCVGKIIAHTAQPDGSHHIMLRGASRARLLQEHELSGAYRTGEVSLMDDVFAPATLDGQTQIHRQLLDVYTKYAQQCDVAQSLLDELLEEELPLSVMTDVIAFAADVDVPFKQFLLGECNVDCRAKLLIQRLTEELLPLPITEYLEHPGAFPPAFSLN